MHKVSGKHVEIEKQKDQKETTHENARRDTLDKIEDYGKRKEVLGNMDTSYIKIKHDVSST